MLGLVLGALLGLLSAVGLVAPALAAIETRVEAFNEKGFGRIVLTFDKLPGYGNELESGVLVLTFDRAIDAQIADLADKISDYVVVARRDPDGRALRMALSRSYLVNIMEAGNQIYIDLLPPDWSGLPPSLPQDVVRELARKAAEAEEKAREESRQMRDASIAYALEVRMARHPTFTRIVFDWNQFVLVNLSRHAGLVTVTFNRRAPVDLSRLRVEAPSFLRSARTLEREEGMAIELHVDDDVDVRGFREGFDYVVDLTGPDSSIERGLEAAAQAARGGRVETEPPPADAVALPAAPGPATDGPSPADAELSQLESGDTENEALGDQWPDEARSVADAPDAGASPAPPDGEPAAARPSAAPAGRGTKAADASPPRLAPGPPLVARVESGPDTVRLTFPFAQPVASAIFRRGRTIWIVFETDAPIDSRALREAGSDLIAGVAQDSVGPAQVIRVTLSRPWLAYASTHDNAWVVSVGNMVTGQPRPLSLIRTSREDNLSLIRVDLKDAGRVHWLRDADIGDRLAVVTAHGPARNVAKSQEFVEFDALATAHGVALRPKADDVAVRLTLDELVVARRDGLTLSAGNAGQYSPGRKALADTGRPGFLDFAAWRHADPGQLSARVHELKEAIALAPQDDRAPLRYQLARVYLANGLAAEALGVARLMVRDEPGIDSDPAFNALRGAALVLMRRPEKARKDLSVHALANDPHASLWRGLMARQQGEWEQALRWFDDGAETLSSYPEDIQAGFRLAAARAALDLDRLDRAAAELHALPDTDPPPALAAEARLLKGRYQDRVGRVEEALESYAAVLAGDHEPSRAEAELWRIALLLRTGAIEPAAAIVGLERLQLSWRGDDVELATLRLLTDLYVREARYRDGFDVMKKALLAFPDRPLALRIQDDMKQVFERLFLHGASDKLRPVEAVSLYYEHREMTPVGRLGDDMIRRLSDRLIAVDLLDQAAELLDHQVERRLTGAARAQVATRLAMVHLMNRKPELALRAIRHTRQAGLPSALLHSRNLLESRALGELGRTEAAMEILNTMEGPEVERLKGDALWTGQRWRQAGEQFEKLLGTRWQEPEPLSDRERFDTLRSAISYALAGDQFALDRLRQKFHDKMLPTADAESFALVTQPVRNEGVALRQLARDIAAIDTLDAFMKEFRERFGRDPDVAREAARAAPGDSS